MPEVDIRRMAVDDMAAVAHLCEQELVLDYDARRLPEVLMRRPHEALVATKDESKLVGVCIGSVAQHDLESPAGIIDLIVVDRRSQRQGVGRRLVAEMEELLRRTGCKIINLTGNAPYFAWPGIDIHYTAAICMAEDLGYRRTGCEVNMDIDLLTAPLDTREDEERLRAAGFVIRPAQPGDETILRTSLAPRWIPVWVDEVISSLHTDGARTHIALRGDECIGFCAYGLGRRNEIGPVGTDPSTRRLGVGAVLLKRCLTDLRDAGFTVAELGWVGPLSYFSRTVNATIGRAFWTYEKDLTSRDRPPDWRDRIGLI